MQSEKQKNKRTTTLFGVLGEAAAAKSKKSDVTLSHVAALLAALRLCCIAETLLALTVRYRGRSFGRQTLSVQRRADGGQEATSH